MKLLGSSGFSIPSSMFPDEWKTPFNLSIGLHIIALVLAMLAPSLFDRKPRLPEIYTVNLFTAVEVAEPPPAPAQTPAAQKTAAEPAVREIEPEVKKPAVSIKPAEPEAAPAVKTITRPVSLKPVKVKKKVGKTPEEEALDKANLSRIVQQMKAVAAEKEAKAEAQKAAKDAVSKLADVLKTVPPGPVTSAAGEKTGTGRIATETKASGLSGPEGTGIEPDFYSKQYYVATQQKIKEHWVLPDHQNWDKSVRAVLVVIVRKDGVIKDTFFEKKSNNIYFNQFVLDTVREASPLPPFPDQLKKETIEFGFRFSPEGLY